MGWRDTLRTASFKGVEFQADIVQDTYGVDLLTNKKSRLSLKDIQGKTKSVELADPFAESVSKRPREVTVVAHFSGDDYQANLNRFIEAVKSGTRGVLVLPSRDQMYALAQSAAITWSNREGGWETVNVRFIEAGEFNTPQSGAATVQQSELRAADYSESVNSAVQDAWDVAGPDYVQDAAEANTDTFLDVADDSLKSGLAGVTFDAVKNRIDQLRTDLPETITDAQALTVELSAIMGDIETAFDTPQQSYNALLGINDQFAALQVRAIAVGTTPAKLAEQSNQQSLQILIQSLSIIGIANILSDLEFASVSDATLVREQVFDRITELQEYIGDLSGDWGDVYKDLTLTRAAIWNDLAARTAALPVIDTLPLREEVPAVVIAYAKYADTDRYTEILTRNDVPRSLFTSGDIEILTA